MIFFTLREVCALYNVEPKGAVEVDMLIKDFEYMCANLISEKVTVIL